MKMTMISRLGIGTFFGILLLTACSKSGGGSGGGTGNGTFSATIDGKNVSGTSSINNAVVIIPADPNASFDSAGDIFVYMQGGGDSIGFHIPDRTGATTFGNGSLANVYGVLTIPNTDPFLFTSVTVNVTLLTKTRIQGTFSGGANTSLLPGGTEVQITNGKFDLPVIP